MLAERHFLCPRGEPVPPAVALRQQAPLTPPAQTTAKLTQARPVTSLRGACGPRILNAELFQGDFICPDFLVEKRLHKCLTRVTFPFLLHRSLGWSPLRPERRARASCCPPAGRATCPPRAGATMSTQPPMVSPAQEWPAPAPGPCLSESQAFSSLPHLLVFIFFRS